VYDSIAVLDSEEDDDGTGTSFSEPMDENGSLDEELD
jgi:hypothetical protein